MNKARTVRIFHGDNAPELEVFAAREAKRYLRRLFRVQVSVEPAPEKLKPISDPQAVQYILVGSPATNTAVAEAARPWPDLSDQGFTIRRCQAPGTLLVGGGSPRATMWAVYELFERCYGVRYLHWDDVFPEDAPAAAEDFQLPQIELAQEPRVKRRVWSGWSDFSLEYWGLADHKRYLDQLAKLKLNAYGLYFLPYHPATKLTFRGVRQSRGMLNWGMEFPIEDDVIGRECFASADRFTNPDLAGCADYDQLHTAFRDLITGIVEHAHSRGIEVQAGFSITDFPREFKEHFAEWATLAPGKGDVAAKADFSYLGSEFMGTDPTNISHQNVDDPTLWELARAVVCAYIDTYPDIDQWTIGTAEFTAPVTDVRAKWDYLDRKYGLAEVRSYDQILEQAAHMQFYQEGRASREVQAAVEFLFLLDKVFVDGQALAATNRPEARIATNCLGFVHKPFSDVAARALTRMFPDQAVTIAPPGGYVMGETLKQLASWSPVMADNIQIGLAYRNENDMVLLLPQVRIAATRLIMDHMRQFESIAVGSTGSRLVRCQDLTAGYVARLFWDSRLTVDSFVGEHLTAICGAAAMPEAKIAFELLEQITDYLDDPQTWLGFPVSTLLSSHFKAKAGAKAEYSTLRQRYEEALVHLKAAYASSRQAGKQYLGYFSELLEFAVRFIDTVQKTREAGREYHRALQGRAQRAPRDAEQGYVNCLRLLGEAIDLMRAALEYRKRLAFDQSERELLIVANNFGYKYLKAIRWIVLLESQSWSLSPE